MRREELVDNIARRLGPDSGFTGAGFTDQELQFLWDRRPGSIGRLLSGCGCDKCLDNALREADLDPTLGDDIGLDDVIDQTCFGGPIPEGYTDDAHCEIKGALQDVEELHRFF